MESERANPTVNSSEKLTLDSSGCKQTNGALARAEGRRGWQLRLAVAVFDVRSERVQPPAKTQTAAGGLDQRIDNMIVCADLNGPGFQSPMLEC